MFYPPIGEQGIWFPNPATAYRITSMGVVGKNMWNKIIADRKNKLESYSVEELLKICAPSHKVNVHKYKCNLELEQYFGQKRAKLIANRYELVVCFTLANIPNDLARYICEKFILI